MALHCQKPALDSSPHSEELRLRVDFFRKLGYSTADVEAAFQKLQLDTDTNAVLGELVRIGARISSSDNEERYAGFKNSLLPPSWTSAPAKSKAETVQKKNTDDELRPIVIDGSNVAMSHGNKTIFSCRGIQLAVNFFLDRGHDKIKVFVPSWRKEQPRPDAPIRDQHILTELEKCKMLVFTPSRHVGGKRVVCYDDRFIVKVASEFGGIIVSNDTYRDLQGENAEWKKCIEERLLMYSFVNDKFMPPDDPLGRHGPTLDNFLRRKPLPTEQARQRCPYDKKCTYGIKCRFYHPERTNQPYISVADELREKAQISSNEPGSRSPPKSSLTKTDSLKSSQISENILLYREAPGSSQNHIQTSVEHSQSEWAGLHPLMPSHHYGNGSQEYLDSGLGSYDSLNNSLWPWPQQQGNNMSQTSQRPFALHISANTDEPKYGPFTYTHAPHSVPSTVPHEGGFPGPLHYSSAPHPEQRYSSAPHPDQRYSSAPHPDQRYSSAPHPDQRYRSAPHPEQRYSSAPHPELRYSSAPHPEQRYSSAPHDQTFWSYAAPPAKTSLPVMHSGPRYNPWAQTPSFLSNDPRMELRSKLQAIFNPADVDRAMEMFPTVTDSEKLAEEIVKLKRGIF